MKAVLTSALFSLDVGAAPFVCVMGSAWDKPRCFPCWHKAGVALGFLGRAGSQSCPLALWRRHWLFGLLTEPWMHVSGVF